MKRITLPERPDWKDKAKADGFGFHTMYGEPYWTENGAYIFTMDQIEKDIEDPSAEIHQMCLDVVDRIVNSEELISHLAIPEEMYDAIRESWVNKDIHLYGRMDLAYNGQGPAKLLEYNADTPTSIFEASYFQYNWLIDQMALGHLPEDADQYNSLQESLIQQFSKFPKNVPFHFSCWSENDEDRGTATYLMDCAIQAGLETQPVDIRYIGVDGKGNFVDQNDKPINRCFKLYPWEDMLREEFAQYLKAGIFVEPLWKSIVSNKGFLVELWNFNKNHPNLLETHRFKDQQPPAGSWVIKPYFSREGENVVILEDGKEVEFTEGDYSESPMIIQERAQLFLENGNHAILGSWIIGDNAAGLGIREDAGFITKNLSRFVPHVIID